MIPFPFQAAGFGRGGFGGVEADPYFANVSALLHFNGTNGSTTFTDVTGKTWTAAGNAALATAQAKFGTASLGLDGTGDWITTASDAAFAVGTGDFTVECFVYVTTTGDRPVFSISSASSGTTGGFTLFARHSSSANAIRFFNTVSSTSTNGSTVCSLNAWHHIAVSRVGTALKCFLDGTQEISVTAGSDFSDTGTVLIGASRGPTPAQAMLGYIDDFRFTKGVGRYTGNFTVPIEAFPDS